MQAVEEMIDKMNETLDSSVRREKRAKPIRLVKVESRDRAKDAMRIAEAIAQEILWTDVKSEAQRQERVEAVDREAYSAPEQSVYRPLEHLGQQIELLRQRQRQKALRPFMREYPLGMIASVDMQGLVHTRPATETDIESIKDRGYLA